MLKNFDIENRELISFKKRNFDVKILSLGDF